MTSVILGVMFCCGDTKTNDSRGTKAMLVVVKAVLVKQWYILPPGREWLLQHRLECFYCPLSCQLLSADNPATQRKQ